MSDASPRTADACEVLILEGGGVMFGHCFVVLPVWATFPDKHEGWAFMRRVYWEWNGTKRVYYVEPDSKEESDE